MIISITGTNTGWSQYVLNGTSKKPRNHNKIQLLRGNIELGDSIITTTNYQHNAYSIVLSFMGKPTLEVINKVVSEFEKYFMHGFSKEEYHLDAVAHFDTDDYHVHIRIPKLNLLTHTQLQLYFDKKDRKRINLIRDLIDLKFGLESPHDQRQLIKEKPDFSQQYSKKAHSNLTSLIPVYDYLRELHQADMIQNFDDVKHALSDLDLIIIDDGYDFSRDCHYLTVKFKNKKIRLKGEFFNEKFWRYSKEDRSKQIRDNKQFRGVLERNKENYRRIHTKLQFELEKRRKEVEQRYSTSRTKAYSRVNLTTQKAQKSFNYSQKPLRKKRATSNKTNIFSPYIAAFSHWNGQLLLTKNNSIGKIANYQKGIIHDYTFTRYFLLRRKIREILRKENHESTHGNTLEKSRTTSSERKNVLKLTRAERNSLYQKATRALQSTRNTRFRREQYRKKIDNIGRECAKVEQQFDSNFATINNLIYHLTRETSETTMNYILHRSSHSKEPAEEEFSLLR